MASHAAFSDTFSMPFQSPHSLVPTWLPSYARYCLLTLSIHSQSLPEFFITGSGRLGTTFPRSPCYQVLDVILSVKYTHAGFGGERKLKLFFLLHYSNRWHQAEYFPSHTLFYCPVKDYVPAVILAVVSHCSQPLWGNSIPQPLGSSCGDMM